jgi:hypothetical protein
LAFASACAACGGSLDVTRTFTPADAASQQQGGRLAPIAVERGAETMALPPGARVEPDRVSWPNEPGEHVHKLAPGDQIKKDRNGQIVEVRSSGPEPVVTRFVPGTVTLEIDEVRGRLADASTVVPLESGDRVRMTGTFASDEPIPGGGHVKTTRSTGVIVAGVTLFALSYAPAAYVGATSSLKTDRDLLIPFAGPWVDLAERPKCVPPAGSEALPINPCIVETISKAAIAASGAIEGLGAILILAGLPSSTRVSYEGDRVAAQRPTLKVVPTFGVSGAGMRAVGTF